MNAHRDPDRLIRAFLMEGQTDLADPVYDAVRARIEETRQRAGIGSWRTPDVNRLLKIGLGAAAVLVVAVVGYNLFPRDGGPGTQQSPSPSETTQQSSSPGSSSLAAGSFSSHGGNIQLDANGDGANVSGSMIYADQGGAELGGFTVDLKCMRETAGGLIFIGGSIRDATKGYVRDAPVGTNVAFILQRGSPVTAEIYLDELPTEPDCATFLESIPDERPQGALEPIIGAISLRP